MTFGDTGETKVEGKQDPTLPEPVEPKGDSTGEATEEGAAVEPAPAEEIPLNGSVNETPQASASASRTDRVLDMPMRLIEPVEPPKDHKPFMPPRSVIWALKAKDFLWTVPTKALDGYYYILFLGAVFGIAALGLGVVVFALFWPLIGFCLAGWSLTAGIVLSVIWNGLVIWGAQREKVGKVKSTILTRFGLK